ncbi:MAG TPA: winged helix-turn-helix domain-containing protein [Verrucomicrobiae bacterium]|nr:winged helix-turn-helix domain-containing protein [Verrucomicrobiae bacterium]
MKKTNLLAQRQYHRFIVFYRQHTGSDWQHFLVNSSMLATALAFLVVMLVYGVVFLTTGSSYAGARALDFGAAKVVVTVLYILDSKKRISFGGPALIIFYLLFVIALVAHAGIDAAVLLALFAVTLLTGLLYGLWCSLVPASVGGIVLLICFAVKLQDAVYLAQANHQPTNLGTLLLHIVGFYVTGLLAGAWHDHYIKRPSNLRAPQAGSIGLPTLFTHDLTIDARKRHVRRGNTTIALRRKEYDILEYLVTNKGQVMTKTMIFESIWSKGSQPDSLGVHIKHLRDKVDKPFDVQLIETLHGVGYVAKDLPHYAKSKPRKALRP